MCACVCVSLSLYIFCCKILKNKIKPKRKDNMLIFPLVILIKQCMYNWSFGVQKREWYVFIFVITQLCVSFVCLSFLCSGEHSLAWYKRRQMKKIYSPLLEGLLALYLGFEWIQVILHLILFCCFTICFIFQTRNFEMDMVLILLLRKI